jgi:predicted transcriptional regulator
MQDDLRPATFMLPPSLIEALDMRARREDRSRSAVARRLMASALEAEAIARGAEVRRMREAAAIDREAT